MQLKNYSVKYFSYENICLMPSGQCPAILTQAADGATLECMNAHQVPFASALDALTAQHRFTEVFMRGTLQVELYAPRGTDPQTPHLQDELYFVQQGSGTYCCADEFMAFGPGDMLFAAAGVTHCFLDFTDDLAVWVVFYGPDGGEQAHNRTVMGQTYHEAQP